MPVIATAIGATRSAHQYPSPAQLSRKYAANAPIMYWAPCVKLMMLSSPKMTDSPRLKSA